MAPAVFCNGFVLILLAVAAILLMYHFLPRHVFRMIVRVGGLVLIGLAILILFRALRHAPDPATGLFGFLFLCGLVFLFIWGLTRWFRSAPRVEQAMACPPVRLLKDMLSERVAPRIQRRLAAHLEICTACQHRVEGLTAGKEAWSEMARKLSHKPPPAAPALKEVIDKLKGDQQPETTRDEPVFAGDLPLGFLTPSDKPGQLGRLDRYEVLEEIGRGGMGVVLKAFDPSLHRVVAIKVLAPQLATSGVARSRFLREAKAAAAVTHDHIVTIHAVEETNGLPYLVMQYIAGLSLQDRIDKEGPITDVAEILRIGMQTASALAAAHGHGIVHRDIKPANILLEEGIQRVKITDFGLARAMDDASLTQSGMVAGSPLYMAPEQARGEALDHRADLFSLGSVLYTVCTGRPPFRAANTLAVLRRVCEDSPRPMRETNPEVPSWLAAVVEKLMAKEPLERFQSASEVVDVLSRHLAQLKQGGPMPAPAAANADIAGLPTSVTICPSCGASLNVPERMVGKVVHCAECGKPLHVEEGSEVIQVARAAKSPFGKRKREKKSIPVWLWIFMVFAVVGLFFVLYASVAVEVSQPPSPATVFPQGVPTFANMQGMGAVAGPFWRNSLGWFPAEASLFGAVDLTKVGSSVNLGDEWTQTVLGLTASSKVAKKLTPENLGRIRIDRVSMAYYEDLKTDKSLGIVQLEGLALDGRKRLIDGIREATSGKVRVEEDERNMPRGGALPGTPGMGAGGATGPHNGNMPRGGSSPGGTMRVSGPDLPIALGVYDDQHVFLARSMNKGSKGIEHLNALEQLSWFDYANKLRPRGDILSGYNPPWLKTSLERLPPDACGLLLGEIPLEWRKWLTATLELRICPRTFVAYLQRNGDTLMLRLSLNVEKPGAEQILMEDLEKWRRQGLVVLKERVPSLRKEPEALALLKVTLNAVRWNADARSSSVRTNVPITVATGIALRTLMERASQEREEAEKVK